MKICRTDAYQPPHLRGPRALPLLGLALLCACGDSPTGPTNQVNSPTLQSIAIAGDLQIEEGSQSQLTVTATYSDGRSQEVTSRATYRSSNEMIAAVSSSGLVTAVRVGGVTVTVSYAEGGITREASAEVEVLRDIPEYLMTVSVSAIRILEDCDPGPFIQTGPGEFTYRVTTQFPGDNGDVTLSESASRFSRQDGESIQINVVRQEVFRGSTGSVEVAYRLTEWDDSSADRNMNNRLGTRTHSLRGGQWSGAGSNEVTIGTQDCRAQLRYTFTASRID